jgi:hypothetical protein
MAEDVKTTAAEVAAAVTGPTTPDNVSVTRPTAKSEWTLFLALGSLCMFAMILIGILAWKHWPDSTDTQRIFFLGWMGFLAVGGILLIVVAIASPYVGHVEASAGSASLKIDGTDGK